MKYFKALGVEIEEKQSKNRYGVSDCNRNKRKQKYSLFAIQGQNKL
jgi:hypothetical protein